MNGEKSNKPRNIFKANKKKNYTVVDNAWIRDSSMSAKAKGIMIFIMSLPEDWQIYESELVRHFKDGKDSIRSGIKELIELGYITRTQLRNEKGQFIGYKYVVSEIPTESGKSQSGEPTLGDSQYGQPEAIKYLPLAIIDSVRTNTTPTNDVAVNFLQKNIQKIKDDITNTIKSGISTEATKHLVETVGIDSIYFYISNWKQWAYKSKENITGFFIDLVLHNRPLPKKERGVNYIPQHHNFEQREYDIEDENEYFENFRNVNIKYKKKEE